jgi:hypothetical protein
LLLTSNSVLASVVSGPCFTECALSDTTSAARASASAEKPRAEGACATSHAATAGATMAVLSDAYISLSLRAQRGAQRVRAPPPPPPRAYETLGSGDLMRFFLLRPLRARRA